MSIYSETQRNRNGRETIRFDNGKDLIVVCGEAPKDRFHPKEVVNSGGSLDMPLPPESLEDHPTQPELLRRG